MKFVLLELLRFLDSTKLSDRCTKCTTNYLRSAICKQSAEDPSPTPERRMRSFKACTMPIQFQKKSEHKTFMVRNGHVAAFVLVFANGHRLKSYPVLLYAFRSAQAKFLELQKAPSDSYRNGAGLQKYCKFYRSLKYKKCKRKIFLNSFASCNFKYHT